MRFKVNMAVVFYDALSEKIISPNLLSFSSDERQIKPIVKENCFTVFTNLDDADKKIRVTSPFYCEEVLEISQCLIEKENVLHISLYPNSVYPKQVNCVTLTGEEKNLVSLSLIAIKKPLWLKISDYDGETVLVENILGNYIPTEIGLYVAGKKDFYTATLKAKQQNGRCAIGGNFTQEALNQGVPTKLYKAQVKASGNFFLLADKTNGDYIASFQYAKKTAWKKYIENGDNLVMEGGG